MTDDAAWNPFTALFNKNNEQSHKLDNIFRLLVQLNQKADHIMTTLQDAQAALDKFQADFETYRAGVKTAADAAVAAYQAGESTAFDAFKAKLNAMDAEIAPAPTPAPAAAPTAAPAA